MRRHRADESQETLPESINLKAFGGKVYFMTRKKLEVSAFLLLSTFIWAQEKEIDTVYIFDSQIHKVQRFHEVQKISAQELLKNPTNLSEVLRFQTPLSIRENGRGAVASPSFRGTTAQQTAFVWNGISINSAFLGQGDLNNIGFLTADQVDVKSGGGSVIYGSGAIGGSIHLDNILRFNRGFQGNFFSSLASFDTFINKLQAGYSNDKLSVKVSGVYNISQNDFEVPERRYLNRNGKYFNTDFNLATGYKINEKHQISWISEFYNAMQHYPIFELSQTKTKYESRNLRSLLSWDWKENLFQNSLKTAFTEDEFSYFDSIDKPRASGGIGRNYIVKNDFNYFFNSKWNAEALTEFQKNIGEGYQSGIKNISRNVISLAGLLRYFPSKTWEFEAGVKKDFVDQIQSPLLFSFSGKWKATSWYSADLNLSKNFRYPSFNDLYWISGGNINLKPETSYQAELRNQIHLKNFKLSLSPYFMDITDMIRWLPSQYGYWAPVNTNKVYSFGVEVLGNYKKKWTTQTLSGNLGYSFTKSLDQDTKKQLMYVPLHKIFGDVQYEYDFFKVYVQGLFTGRLFTDSKENINMALDPYFVMNTGFNVTLYKTYSLGFAVNNIFNEIYETSAYYYMPKRNYNLNININF